MFLSFFPCLFHFSPGEARPDLQSIARCVASTFPRPEPIVRRRGKAMVKGSLNFRQNSFGDDE